MDHSHSDISNLVPNPYFRVPDNNPNHECLLGDLTNDMTNNHSVSIFNGNVSQIDASRRFDNPLHNMNLNQEEDNKDCQTFQIESHNENFDDNTPYESGGGLLDICLPYYNNNIIDNNDQAIMDLNDNSLNKTDNKNPNDESLNKTNYMFKSSVINYDQMQQVHDENCNSVDKEADRTINKSKGDTVDINNENIKIVMRPSLQAENFTGLVRGGCGGSETQVNLKNIEKNEEREEIKCQQQQQIGSEYNDGNVVAIMAESNLINEDDNNVCQDFEPIHDPNEQILPNINWKKIKEDNYITKERKLSYINNNEFICESPEGKWVLVDEKDPIEDNIVIEHKKYNKRESVKQEIKNNIMKRLESKFDELNLNQRLSASKPQQQAPPVISKVKTPQNRQEISIDQNIVEKKIEEKTTAIKEKKYDLHKRNSTEPQMERNTLKPCMTKDTLERVTTATLDSDGKIVLTTNYVNNDAKFIERYNKNLIKQDPNLMAQNSNNKIGSNMIYNSQMSNYNSAITFVKQSDDNLYGSVGAPGNDQLNQSNYVMSEGANFKLSIKNANFTKNDQFNNIEVDNCCNKQAETTPLDETNNEFYMVLGLDKESSLILPNLERGSGGFRRSDQRRTQSGSILKDIDEQAEISQKVLDDPNLRQNQLLSRKYVQPVIVTQQISEKVDLENIEESKHVEKSQNDLDLQTKPDFSSNRETMGDNGQYQELFKMYKLLDQKLNSLIESNSVNRTDLTNYNDELLKKVKDEFESIKQKITKADEEKQQYRIQDDQSTPKCQIKKMVLSQNQQQPLKHEQTPFHSSNPNLHTSDNNNNIDSLKKKESLLPDIYGQVKTLNDKINNIGGILQNYNSTNNNNNNINNSIKVQSYHSIPCNNLNQQNPHQNHIRSQPKTPTSLHSNSIKGLSHDNTSTCYQKVGSQTDTETVCALEKKLEEEQEIREALIKLLTMLRDRTYEKRAMKFFKKSTYYEIIGKKMNKKDSLPLRSKLLNFLSIFLSQVETKQKAKMKRNHKIEQMGDYYNKQIKVELDRNNRRVIAVQNKARNMQDIENNILKQNNNQRVTIKVI